MGDMAENDDIDTKNHWLIPEI